MTSNASSRSSLVARHVVLGLVLLTAGAAATHLPAARSAIYVAMAASVVAHAGGALLLLIGMRAAVAAHRTRLTDRAESTASAHPLRARGQTIRWATAYDALVATLSFGREAALRRTMLQLAAIAPGERVLDVGCGTGTLAIAAKRVVGDAGVVHGVDYGAEMITRARFKAARARLAVHFDAAPAQALHFADATFDVVLCTLMLHHLPRPDRAHAIAEAQRVLVSGGRLLVVDLGRATGVWRLLDPISLVHGQHEQTITEDAAAEMRAAGFGAVRSGPVGARALGFAIGWATETAPADR